MLSFQHQAQCLAHTGIISDEYIVNEQQARMGAQILLFFR
jgi:hypothetical protein